mgnify:CR=1 FL=1
MILKAHIKEKGAYEGITLQSESYEIHNLIDMIITTSTAHLEIILEKVEKAKKDEEGEHGNTV